MNYSIKVAAKRSGLSTHVIRVWERRYGAVKPERTQTNRRSYSGAEIERLALLRQVTEAGHAIRNVAGLATSELQSLAEQESRAATASPAARSLEESARRPLTSNLVADGIDAIKRLDGEELERILQDAVVALGQRALLQQVMVPLIESVGGSWHQGEIRVAHEHIATAIIRTFLGTFIRSFAASASVPRLVVTTPPGQLHELGAMLVAAAASNHGWQVTYLGPCLPAEEIAGAATQSQARAVALSLVYPQDDPRLELELTKLRQLLPKETALLVGGRAAPAYESVLARVGAIQLHDLPGVYAALDQLGRKLPDNES